MGKIKSREPIDWKAVSVSPETREQLIALSKKNETYDTFIKKLLMLRENHIPEFEKIEVTA